MQRKLKGIAPTKVTSNKIQTAKNISQSILQLKTSAGNKLVHRCSSDSQSMLLMLYPCYVR